MVWMSSDNAKKAFHLFSRAFLINFIFGIVILAFTLSMVGIAVATLAVPPDYQENPRHIFLTFIFPSMLVSLIGNIVFVYYLWQGFEIMEGIIPKVNYGKIGSILLLIGSLSSPFLLTPFFNFSATNPPMFSPLAYFGFLSIFGIVGFIGIILLVVAIYHIGERYDNSTVKVGAILYIFLSFIAAIILYFGFRDLESSPNKEKSVVLPPPPPW